MSTELRVGCPFRDPLFPGHSGLVRCNICGAVGSAGTTNGERGHRCHHTIVGDMAELKSAWRALVLSITTALDLRRP